MHRVFLAVFAIVIGCTSTEPTQAVAPSGPLPAKSITIEGPGTVEIGLSIFLVAVVLDTSNRRMTNPDVTWTTSDASVATISAFGIVTGRREGTVRITAAVGPVEETGTLNVISRVDCPYSWDTCSPDQ